ncbi:MAG: hypothetical protein ACI8X3_003427, partial [Saprospiraceae bacterium]
NKSAGKVGMESGDDWGFFAHRRINRMAVFTLPPEMMVFYKKHIEYITDHAVDPDKRRYATRHEAVRHYIDIDQWGEYPFDNVPRIWTDALLKYTSLNVINSKGDTIQVVDNESIDKDFSFLKLEAKFIRRFNLSAIDSISYEVYRSFFITNILPQYYEDEWVVEADSLNKLLGQKVNCKAVFAIDHFSEHGILPYHLEKMQRNLTEAFLNKDAGRILRLSAEFGHYLGDAHVPLHTTSNYNGQLTNQLGIHAFWESRIPELFADNQFDFFVGKSEYMDKPRDDFWGIVLKSHSYVDSVLQIEKSLSKSFPEDQQYCYDDRMETTIRTQCKAYAAAFNKRMDGMVESRMRGAILAIGTAWYTAWVDAGQPNLRDLLSEDKKTKEDEDLEESARSGAIKGREH